SRWRGATNAVVMKGALLKTGLEAVLMRKILIAVAVLLVAACSSNPRPGTTVSHQSGTGATSGAPTAKAAVEAFMAAVKGQDLQRMSMLWGTEKGLARDQMSRDDLEKRLVVMQCTMTHDSWMFTGKPTLLRSSYEQDFEIELHQKNFKAQTTVTTVKGAGERWYVKNVDLVPLNQFCR
ncbi:MAG: hypothetical protein M3Y64_07790, partial [Gemmatimonadota bacterium]|nr:hypothetical protein [Gemmatimonadota bacterium]